MPFGTSTGTLITPTDSQTATFTGGTWGAWNNASTTSASTCGDDIWNRWAITTGSGSTTITATNSCVFQLWNAQGQTSATNDITWGNMATGTARGRLHVRYSAPRVTEEELAARAQRAEEQARIARLAQAQRAQADDRAMRLLRTMLNDEQNQDLEKDGHFFVPAPSGRLYRISKGRSGNVKVVDPVTRVWKESLCIHQRMNVPYGDTMLMQKLLIETHEEEFRATANIDFKDGGYDYSKGGLLTGERLAQVIPFPQREAA
jgi:hypothetical protein